MKLVKLVIKNFRNIKDLTLNFGAGTNSVCGENGIGKTSVIDSVMWLLCDETFVYGKQNEDNKNKNDHTQAIHITGTFKKDNENELELERIYFEKWNDDEFDRIENQFKINGTKYKATEYFDRIREEIGIKNNTKVKKFNLLRCLIDTNYLDSVDYKDARKFIEEILNLTSDEELLKNKQFESIANKLYGNNYDLDKTKSYYRDKLKDAENEITKLENECNLLAGMLVTNDKDLAFEKNNLIKDLTNKADFERQAIYDKANEQIKEKENQIEQNEKEYREKIKDFDDQINACINKGNKLKHQVESTKMEINATNAQVDTNKYTINLLKSSIDKDTNELKSLKAETFAEIKCPECGFVLNGNDRNEFEKGKQQKIKNLTEKIAVDKAQLERNNQILKENTSKVDELQSKLKDLEKDFNDESDKYKEFLSNKQDAVKAYDSTLSDKLSQDITDIKVSAEKEVNSLIEKHNEKINNINAELYALNESINKRKIIDEKKESIKNFKADKAQCELCLDSLENFKQLKLTMTKENTKKVFPNIEFEMLEISPTTGSIQECCHPTLNNVEFGGINNGNKYLIGVEVIEDIKRALGVTEDLPIIFDRKADIDQTNYRKLEKLTNAQIINTCVTDNNKICVHNEVNKTYVSVRNIDNKRVERIESENDKELSSEDLAEVFYEENILNKKGE